MTTQEILDALKFNTGQLPRQALQEAMAKKEEITPELLKIMEEARGLPEVLHDVDYMAHIYGMYLLAQFREKRAYPLIVEFFSIPGEVTVGCTGEVVTEHLHRILASVSQGDASLIKSLVENHEAEEFVRGAALEALLTQVACGQATRAEVMAYYQSLFRGGLEKEPSHVWDSLADCCTDLYPEEVMADIRQAYDEGLVNETYIRRPSLSRQAQKTHEKILQMWPSVTKRMKPFRSCRKSWKRL